MSGQSCILLLLLLVGVADIATEPAQAGVTVEASGSCGTDCTLYRIKIFGLIDTQTRESFLKAMDDPRIKRRQTTGFSLVSLNSPGGSVSVAMAIGEIIRRESFWTGVIEGSQCNSACVLILAAGVHRTASFGKIGIHRPRFDEEAFALLSPEQARSKYNAMAEGVRRYLAQMGMSDGLYTAMLRVPSDEISILSYKAVREYGLEGDDPSWAEYQRAKAIQLQGREAYEVNQSYSRVYVACLNAPAGSVERCNHVRVQFMNQLDSCSRKPEAEHIGCAKAIERQMTSKYR